MSGHSGDHSRVILSACSAHFESMGHMVDIAVDPPIRHLILGRNEVGPKEHIPSGHDALRQDIL